MGVPDNAHGDRDAVVPIEGNSGELARRYQDLGGQMTLNVVKWGGARLLVRLVPMPGTGRFCHCKQENQYEISDTGRCGKRFSV